MFLFSFSVSLLPDAICKETSCQLECDALGEHILNRESIKGKTILLKFILCSFLHNNFLSSGN